VAQPDYLARSEQLATPQDLKGHAIIAFTGLMANREWRYSQAGQTKYVKLSPRLEVNDAATAIAGTLAGEGITVALSYMVAEDIKAGRLVPVLETFAPPPVPVQIIYPQSRLVAPKVRAFVDFASPRLKAALEGL
jgi:DNA-binding transcriptional LysR family regulator